MADGSVGAPSINFSSSTSTGIFSPETGKIALSAAGTLFLHNVGTRNTALGFGALASGTTGSDNVALGFGALGANTTASNNIALGRGALGSTTGGSNTALGRFALGSVTTGFNNIAIGSGAGQFAGNNTSHSIFIGDSGGAFDNATIRIGNQSTQTSAFIAGIKGRTTGQNDAVPVLIDSLGQLGTVSSSRRYKHDIAPMGDVSETLMRLRPVTFRYKKLFADGSKPIQYGLIAEEVANVLPALTVFNDKGQPETVKYHLLPSFLLAGHQEQQRTIRTQAAVNERQQKLIQSQRDLNERQQALIKTQAEKIAALERRLAALESSLSKVYWREAAMPKLVDSVID